MRSWPTPAPRAWAWTGWCRWSEARRRTGGRVALQGNLDPATLYGSPEAIRAEVQRALRSYGDGPGHVFNLGHGMSPDMDPAHVAVLVDAVHEFSRASAG